MRIIHLSYHVPTPNYTDPAAWIKRISFSVVVMESMATYGKVIGIYHINWKGVLHKNNVQYHFPGYNRWQLFLPIQFNRYVKKLTPDVVIVHGLIFPWQILMLHFQLGRSVKIIAQHHAERPLRDIRQYFQRWADRYIDAYLFSSIDLGMRWVEKNQIQNRNKIKVIMGTSSTFYPIEKRQAKIKTNVIGDNIFLWVGRLDANKDPLVVAKAFLQFSKLHHGVSLYMIYQTNELEEKLKALVNGDEGGDRIHLVGNIAYDELLWWYNSADYIISSSHYEGSGIAVCEAMSCGCIPILTDIPSFQMMSNYGEIGFLYPAGNIEALCMTFEKSLNLDQKTEREKVIKQFNENLSGDANARKIMEVVQSIALKK